MTVALVFFGLLSMACLLAVAGIVYLREGDESLQRSMNLILWFEMRLGHWEKA